MQVPYSIDILLLPRHLGPYGLLSSHAQLCLYGPGLILSDPYKRGQGGVLLLFRQGNGGKAKKMMVKDIALRSLNGTPAVDLPLLDIGMPYDDPLRHGQIPVHLKFCKVSDAVGPQHNFYIGDVGSGIGRSEERRVGKVGQAQWLECA